VIFVHFVGVTGTRLQVKDRRSIPGNGKDINANTESRSTLDTILPPIQLLSVLINRRGGGGYIYREVKWTMLRLTGQKTNDK